MSGFFPIVWTDRGIVYRPRPSPRRTGVFAAEVFFADDDPLLTSDVSAIVLRWGEPWAFALDQRWPRARLRWSGGDIDLRPGGLFGTDPEGYAERMEALVAHLERRAPSRLTSRGWLEFEHVPWERVAGMPEPATQDAVGEGAFRSARRPVEEVAVASREKPSALEAMLEWLASSPDRPWRHHPRQVRLSEEYFYAARRDGSVWRVPLSSLRARYGDPNEDAVYVFGRRTKIVLTHRAEPCPVRARLDAELQQT
jgi:hypothetical protein